MKTRNLVCAAAVGCMLLFLCLSICGCGGYDADGAAVSVIRSAGNPDQPPIAALPSEAGSPGMGTDASEAALPAREALSTAAFVLETAQPETTLPDPPEPPAQPEESTPPVGETAASGEETENPPEETTTAEGEPPAVRETTTVPNRSAAPVRPELPEGAVHVVINTSSGKFHLDPNCASAKQISAANRLERDVASVAALEAAGYSPCGRCSVNRAAETTRAETSAKPPETPVERNIEPGGETYTVVLNRSSRKIHLDPDCRYVATMKEENKQEMTLTREELEEWLAEGCTLCKSCSGDYK